MVLDNIENITDPYSYGSGFLLEHNNRLFLFTAAHLLYEMNSKDPLDENVEGLNLFIDSKILKEGKSQLIAVPPMNSITSFEQLSHGPKSLFYDRLDFIFTEIPNHDISVHYIDESNYDYEKDMVHIFSINMIEKFDTEQLYFTSGFINPVFNKDNQLERDSIILSALKVINIFKSGEVLLKCNYEGVFPDVRGISGAPIINKEGKLCGIVRNADSENKTILAIPFSNILSLMTQLAIFPTL